MPQDLPGFYYDPDKNRYFPIKGPIPGSTHRPKPAPPSQNSVSLPTQVPSKPKKRDKISKLLQCRELCGSIIDFRDRKGGFQEECKKKLASKPRIWRYQGLEKDADCSLALIPITIETEEGQFAADALITGGMNGSLSLFDVGDVGRHTSHGHKTAAEFVWPERDDPSSYETLKDIWKFNGATLIMPSSTNRGATLVDLESGVSSTLCSSKSDVLSVQFIHSGNVALCGLRYGAIVTVDVRQPQRQLARHRILHPSIDSTRPAQKTTKPFVLKGNIQPSCTVYMPSSICCLASLQMYDQYFLASSMDGSIKLYDHRLTKRGPVQSYEGHVNSHSHIQLATDASERFLMSGGEDGKVRIWSIRSGEMLFEEKLSSCVPMTACWRVNAEPVCKRQSSEEWQYAQSHNWDAWLGSAEGLLRLQFCL